MTGTGYRFCVLHGREHERTVLRGLLAGARAGGSGVLVLRGEAGIGKSALLDEAVRAAGDFVVLRGRGVESAAELPFAGLHLLLRGVLDGADGAARLAALPAPQRGALQNAFGMGDAADAAVDAARDRLLVGLAALSVLSELATDRPVLCVVDDAHLLDGASRTALLLAAHRLMADRVVMLLAVRQGEGTFPSGELPELAVPPLRTEDAAALLDERVPGLPAPARRRVLAEACGVPLALIEMPAVAGSDPAGPLTDRLRRVFADQVDALPPRTRMLLLVAAADDSGEVVVVLRAAELLGVGADDFPPAERTGFARAAATGAEGEVFGAESVVFRHPLARAAVYRQAPLADRIAVHRALAAVLTAPQDADRRAWHLAAAATAPDEAAAAELERTAERARQRTGHSAAAAAYRRAAALSGSAADRADRLAAAAKAATQAGDLDIAVQLASSVADGTDDPVSLATADHVRALGRFAHGDFPAAHALLCDGAALITDRDPRRATRMLIQACHAAWYVAKPTLVDTVTRLAAVPLPPEDSAVPVRDFLIGAFGTPGPPPSFTGAVAGARSRGVGAAELVVLCGTGVALGMDWEVCALADQLADELRRSGGIGLLPTVLLFLAQGEMFTGHHRAALVHTSEALSIAHDTGQRHWVGQCSAVAGYLAAIAGDAEGCRAHVGQARTSVVAGMTTPGDAWSLWAVGMLELGLGRLDRAIADLGRLSELSEHHVCGLRSIPDLVEAAVRAGEPERVKAAAERLTTWARRWDRPWAAALDERCRALLAPDSSAEDHYRAALRLHEADERTFEWARTRLLYGEWLRRGRHRVRARRELAAAREVFERLGAVPWAARAGAELDATGAPVPESVPPGPLAELTPQELHIVRLAGQGLSNRDIAERLFLSPRTVGYHLYKAYPKLGVASRRELAAVPGLAGVAGRT